MLLHLWSLKYSLFEWWCICPSLVCCLSLLDHLWRSTIVSSPVQFHFSFLPNFINYCRCYSWSVAYCMSCTDMHSGISFVICTASILILKPGISLALSSLWFCHDNQTLFGSHTSFWQMSTKFYWISRKFHFGRHTCS